MPGQRLSRARIVEAAIDIADREGVDAVSMRRLAQELGVVPMAMYKHIADKGELSAAMIDSVVSEYPAPSDQLGWRDALLARIRGARQALGRHPWMRQAIEQSTSRTPTVLGHMDAVAGELRRGGFSYDLVHYAMHALGHRIWGFSPEAFSAPSSPSAKPPSPDELAHAAALFPHVVAIAQDAAMRNPTGACDAEREFNFTLELLLDAFDRLRAEGWSSR